MASEKTDAESCVELIRAKVIKEHKGHTLMMLPNIMTEAFFRYMCLECDEVIEFSIEGEPIL